MESDNSIRNYLPHLGDFTMACFDGLQSFAPKYPCACFVFGEELRCPSVNIPAQVIKFRLRRELAYLLQALLLHIHKSNNHIGDLYPGVIDVILHLQRAASVPQHSRDGVAQHGVSHMPNMRRLIWINAGVLDYNFARTIRYRNRA